MFSNDIKISRWAILTGVAVVAVVLSVIITNVTSGSVFEPTTETDAVIAGTNQFAFDFYAQLLANNPTANQFFSPWSIVTALALAGEGARGQTADEIWDAFGLSDIDPETRRNAFKAIADAISRPSNDYELAVANSFWQRFAPPQEYTDIAKRYYNAEVFDLPTNPDPINDWAANNTNGKIKKVINRIDEQLFYLIVNALYFKGDWQNKFKENRTKDEVFWTGNQEIIVPLMSQRDKFNYTNTNEFQAIELPYDGGRVSMLVLLPYDRNGIEALEQLLDANMLESIKNNFFKLDGVVKLPKFKLTTSYNLINYAQKLGINLAFIKKLADFSGVFPPDVPLPQDFYIYIDKFVQNAFVEVNEEGTEAVAATTLGLAGPIGPAGPNFIFRADHPFIFLIQDNETGNILFMGKITDPS